MYYLKVSIILIMETSKLYNEIIKLIYETSKLFMSVMEYSITIRMFYTRMSF